MLRCNYCNELFNEAATNGICPRCGKVIPVDDERTVFRPIPPVQRPQAPIPQPNPKPQAPQQAPSAAHVSTLPLGTLIHNRYQVMGIINAGQTEITYRVLDCSSKLPKTLREYYPRTCTSRLPGSVALLPPAPKFQEEFENGKNRLLEEARVLSSVQSVGILRVDDYFEENGTAYSVMEYLEGISLTQHIRQRGQVLSPSQVVNLGVQLCDALETLHASGVIHRAISPDTILLMRDGRVKITDFRSARLSRSDCTRCSLIPISGYSPPELYVNTDKKKNSHHTWTDIYSLGATLYFCLTGRVPANSLDRISGNLDRLVDPASIYSGIPEHLNNSIMAAMAVMVHERIQSAAELKRALLQERNVPSMSDARKKHRRARTLSALIAFVLLLSAAVAGLIWYWNGQLASVVDPAAITVWYPLPADSASAQKKVQAMELFREELQSSHRFSSYTLDLIGIPEADYAAQLHEAAENETLPTVFETPDAKAGYMDHAVEIPDVLSRIDEETCRYLPDMLAQEDTLLQFPIGFHIPVVYINTELVPDWSNDLSIHTAEELLELCGDKAFALNETLRETYETLLPDFDVCDPHLTSGGVDDFLNGEAALLFSDTADLAAVREALDDTWAVIPIEAEEIPCTFCNRWSISEANPEAAAVFLAYLCSSELQELYYLEAELPGIPLDTEAYETYVKDNKELSGLLEDPDRFLFN